MGAVRLGLAGVLVLLALGGLGRSRAVAGSAPDEALHRLLDALLDGYVRDGRVYYGALRRARAALDRDVASLDVEASRYERWSREDRLAFWIDAYNALVLQTVPPERAWLERNAFRLVYKPFDWRLNDLSGVNTAPRATSLP